MSRSYKKHPVCTSHETLKPFKKERNRKFRRKLKQGLYADDQMKGRAYAKWENFDWDEDVYHFYWTERDKSIKNSEEIYRKDYKMK